MATAQPALAGELEQYRRELTGYCYRMLGSAFDAEDAVVEYLCSGRPAFLTRIDDVPLLRAA